MKDNNLIKGIVIGAIIGGLIGVGGYKLSSMNKGAVLSNKEYAEPIIEKLVVDDTPVDLNAYQVGGDKFFRIKDLAENLAGTGSNFSLAWSEDKDKLNLLEGEDYIPTNPSGGEEVSKPQPVQDNLTPIYKDGEDLGVFAINIGGNMYLKLEDLKELIDLDLSYKDNNLLLESKDRNLAKANPNQEANEGKVETPRLEDKNPILQVESQPTTNPNPTSEPVRSSAREIIPGLYKYELEIEYNDRDIEYKYKVHDGGRVEAKYKNELTQTKTYGDEAANLIETRLLTIDYNMDRSSIVSSILNSLSLGSDYEEFELKIKYTDGRETKIEIKNK